MNLGIFYSWIDKSIEIELITQKCLLVIYGKVRVILANTNELVKYVVIYARVNSNVKEE